MIGKRFVRNISLYSKCFRLANRAAVAGHASDEWSASDDTFYLAWKGLFPHSVCEKYHINYGVAPMPKTIKNG